MNHKKCPHFIDGKCAFPDWLLEGKPYLACQAVREIHTGCPQMDKESRSMNEKYKNVKEHDYGTN